MRTLRELAGWGVLLSLWVIPPATVLAVALWIDANGSALWPALGLLLVLAWPGLRRLGRTWRSPSPEEHAEADGRRPVLLLHRSADQELPWYRRLFVFQSGYWRAARDQSWREALSSSYAALGPVVPLGRPPAPAGSGPAAMLRPDPKWGPTRERRLKTARLAVIVLDGTEACRDDISAAFEVLGPRRTALIMPAKPDPALAAAWPSIQARVPGLPAFDSHALAFRFAKNGAVLAFNDPRGMRHRRKQLAQPRRMLFAHERDAPPKPPSWAPVAMGLPAVAGFAGAVAVPILLDFERVDVRESVLITGALGSVVLGVMLSVMGRRMFRLVTANELPFVVVASMPWLLYALVPWLSGRWTQSVYRLDHWLALLIAGAAFSAPLLLATSVMLSASALARRAPNRRTVFAVFGVVALVPFGTLVALLSDGGTYVFGVAQFLLAGGVAAGLAVVAASGDANRPHGPLPLGAGVSAALSVGAWATVVTTQEWRTLISVSSPGDIRRLAAQAPALVTFGESWVWFLGAVPLLVGLVASLHRGRGSRTAVGNVWALAPMVVVFGLVSTAQAGARTAFSRAYVQAGGLILTQAMPRGAGAEVVLAGLGTGNMDPRPLDAVVTADALFIDGERMPQTEGGLRQVSRRVRSGDVLRDEEVRVGVDAYAPAGDLERLVQTLNASGRSCVLADLEGRSLRVRAASGRPLRRDQVHYVLQLRPRLFVLAGTNGANSRGESMEELTDQLRMQAVSRERIFVTVDERTQAQPLMDALTVLRQYGFHDIVLGAPPMLR